jgi:hypothetical protein
VRSEQFSVWLGGGARQDTTSNLSLATSWCFDLESHIQAVGLLRSVLINCGAVATVPSKTQITNKLVLNLRVSAAEAQCVETHLHCHIRSTRRPVFLPLALPKMHSRQTTERPFPRAGALPALRRRPERECSCHWDCCKFHDSFPRGLDRRESDRRH